MEEQLIGFETAKLAKEKGFKYKTNKGYCTKQLPFYVMDCEHYYDFNSYTDKNRGGWAKGFGDMYASTSQSLLQKWLRDTYNIQVYVHSQSVNLHGIYRDYVANVNGCNINDCRDEEYQTYEQAMEAGLLYALKSMNTCDLYKKMNDCDPFRFRKYGACNNCQHKIK